MGLQFAVNDPAAARSRTVSASERMALLHKLVFTALRLGIEQLDRFSFRLIDALEQYAAQEHAPADAATGRQAAEHLKQHRATFHRLINDSLQQALLRAVQLVGAEGASRLESGAMDLSLLSFDAMERKVLIDNLSQAIDAPHADALAALGMRIADWMQSDRISVAHNPFRAEIFLRAVADAWSKFDPERASLRVVLLQLQTDVFLQLDGVLHALNQELIACNVLPDIEQDYRRKIAGLVPAASLDDRLRGWLAPQGASSVSAARVTTLAEKTFAHFLCDAVIPDELRSVLGRLREPLVKAALAESALFFSGEHPARRLLIAMASAGLACRLSGGSADPTYRMLEGVADRLGNQAAPDAFGDALAELDAFMAAQQRTLGPQLQQAIAEATRDEGRSQAQRLAEQDVAARIASGEVAGFVETFLQMQWTRVLAFAYGVRDTKREVLPNVLSTMDELIRSVQPKAGLDERRELVNRLPRLLATLNAWLNVIKWSGAERDGFFAALAERHAAAMRAPREPTPRHQLEMRMNVVQKASEHHLTRRAQEQRQAALAEFIPLVDGLVPGSWVELVRNDGSRVNCRVAWVSAARSRFIFIVPQTELLFTLADDVLAQALRADRAHVIPVDSLTNRALEAALEELGVS